MDGLFRFRRPQCAGCGSPVQSFHVSKGELVSAITEMAFLGICKLYNEEIYDQQAPNSIFTYITFDKRC